MQRSGEDMLMRIPVPAAHKVEIRIANLFDRDHFGERWQYWTMNPSSDGFWEREIAPLGLADGDYEYEFVVDDDHSKPVADPYAKEITRFGGYRALLHIRNGQVWSQPPFDWSDELPAGTLLPENNRIVVYEMPLRWMEGDLSRQVGLGTFEKVVFTHLDRLAKTGVNCIELLPPLDSPDTLNWGYGTRFFFAPDYDMGGPVDLKWFIKKCHQRGIRVFVDVVMNHARDCPLARLARERYFIRREEEPGRGEDYSADMFRYREMKDGHHWARLLHFDVARFLIEEYHVDGFRIDEFRGIDNWEFIQQFRNAAWQAFRSRFPDRPFIVIAEDSWSRTAIVRSDDNNPNQRKVVDAMWNFSYRDELRRLLLNNMHTVYGQPARRERIIGLISGNRRWDALLGRFDGGFGDMAQSVAYITSHDVERDGERRLMNHVLSSLLIYFNYGNGSFEQVRDIAETMQRDPRQLPEVITSLYQQALDRVRSAYALVMTSVAIPMLLAGEEFADIHDTNHYEWQLKMSDPVDWDRSSHNGHRETAAAVTDLIWMRHGHPALHRNDVEFFHFHPTIDENDGRRVFAYCRTAGHPIGASGQIVTVANLGAHNYPSYVVPWPWMRPWSERGPRPGTTPIQTPGDGSAILSLQPFEARVFELH
jgi:1,4-alpha-glucan branching enzyme